MKKVYLAFTAGAMALACNGESPSQPVDACALDRAIVQCDPNRATSLQPFTAPSTSGSGVLVQAMTDKTALEGIGSESVVDGWEIRFTEVLATFDYLTLNDNPTREVGEPEHVVGEARGPFAVDLLNFGGGSMVKPINLALLATENLTCDTPALDAGKGYGFGYDVVPATFCAKNVNVRGEAATDYEEMIEKGYSVMIVGNAFFRGSDGVGGACDGGGADYSQWPTLVTFHLGLKAALRNADCGGSAIGPKSPAAQAQITVRTAGLFSSSLADKGGQIYFDQIAARYANGSSTSALATIEDFSQTSFAPFERSGESVVVRSCSGGAGGAPLSFETKGTNGASYLSYLESALIKSLRFNGSSTCTVAPATPSQTTDEAAVPSDDL